MSSLVYRERPADGEAEGLLVLHHGRGADEHDLLGLADVLDPQRRLHVVTPGRPLTVPGLPGQPLVRRPARRLPGPRHVRGRYAQLAAFHDELWDANRHRPAAHRARRLLDGLGDELRARARRRPAGGRPGSSPSPASSRPSRAGLPTSPAAQQTRVFIAHGRQDPVMDVEFARRAHELLTAGGLEVEYHESDAGHYIDPAHVPAAISWLKATLP